jgi:putative flippase GtrA
MADRALRLPRWMLFTLVGLAGFVVQLLLLAVLTRRLGWHPALATAVAMQLVLAQNYIAHSRWTWADRPTLTRRERLLRPLRYQGTKTLTLALNVLMTSALVHYGHLAPELGNAIAVGLCAFVNYTAADWFVFSVTNAQHDG